MPAVSGLNIYEFYDVYSVLNSHMLINTCWFFSLS